MTANTLKSNYERHNPKGLFFAWLYDDIEDFTVEKSIIRLITNKGIEDLEVYDLIRKQSAKSGLYGHCAYFRKDNFEVVFNHA